MLSALLLLNTLAIPLYYLDYELRKDFITEYFCINKDKPELHCNGQCHLMKEVEQTSSEQKKKAEKPISTVVYLIQEMTQVAAQEKTVLPLLAIKHTTPYTQKLFDFYTHNIFHPPC
ncbi:hypothetical protein V6R21_30680 [Limibacter armeniacum]|uniref:hypothetical protein n=1 Tax=Limibacter armeniacum TaxID=466084 RepID=UPI002FE5288F